MKNKNLKLVEIIMFNEVDINSSLDIKDVVLKDDILAIYFTNNKFLTIRFEKKNVNYQPLHDFIKEFLIFNNIRLIDLIRKNNHMLSFFKGMLMYFLKKFYNLSNKEIAYIFYLKNSSNVSYYINKFNNLLSLNKKIYKKIYVDNLEKFKLYF